VKDIPEQGHFVVEISAAKWERVRVKGLYSRNKSMIVLLLPELLQREIVNGMNVHTAMI